MNWENAKENNCPHCAELLIFEEEIIECTGCKFKIEPERLKLILTHRAKYKQRPLHYPQMKWQNLIDHKCPICASFLRDRNTGIENQLLECLGGCGFKIRSVSLDAIIQNPNHLANIFREKEKNA